MTTANPSVRTTVTSRHGVVLGYDWEGNLVDVVPAPTVPAGYPEPRTKDGRPKYHLVNPDGRTIRHGTDQYLVDGLGRRVEVPGIVILNNEDGTFSPKPKPRPETLPARLTELLAEYGMDREEFAKFIKGF